MKEEDSLTRLEPKDALRWRDPSRGANWTPILR